MVAGQVSSAGSGGEASYTPGSGPGAQGAVWFPCVFPTPPPLTLGQPRTHPRFPCHGPRARAACHGTGRAPASPRRSSWSSLGPWWAPSWAGSRGAGCEPPDTSDWRQGLPPAFAGCGSASERGPWPGLGPAARLVPAGHRGLFWKNRWLQWLLKIATRGFHWLTPQGAGWNLVSDPVGFLNASAQGSVMMSKEPDVRISVPRIRLWARGCGGQERGVLSGRCSAGAPRRSRGKRACARGSPRTRRLWGRGAVSAGGWRPLPTPSAAPRPGGQRAWLRLLPSGPKLESSLGGTRGVCGDS